MKNKRLQAIADCVQAGCVAADIGTDHAYLPCALIQSNKAVKCYACDIAEGPLESARQTIREAGLTQKIETRLCPGLRDVPADANVAVIAGMGWMTAKTILEEDFAKLNQFDQIIVQVNRDVAKLREWIDRHRFAILEEKAVHDRFYYVIVVFSAKKQAERSLSREELIFGPLLLQQSEPVVLDYFHFLLERNRQIVQRAASDSERAKELHWQIDRLEKKLEENRG